MLISLTSHNEVNPARFKNHFHNPVVIKKNSYICLVAGQIIRDAVNKIVIITPNTVFNIRVDAYNCFQLVLNQGGNANVSQTPAQLVTALNAARQANVALQQADQFFEFQVSQDPNFAFSLKVYNRMNYNTANSTLKTYIYGANGDNYNDQKWNLLQGYTDTVPSSQNNANRPEIPTSANYGLGIAWDNTYYDAPTNQVNKNATNLVLSPNPSMDLQVNEFSMTNINLGDTRWVIGPAVCSDANPPVYTNAPIRGFGNAALAKFMIEFQHNFGYNLRLWNNAQNALELKVTDNAYSFGDQFLITMNADPNNPPAAPENLAYPTVIQGQTDGLAFMYVGKMGDIANRPAGANYLLSNNVAENNDITVSNNMSFVYDANELYDLQTDSQPQPKANGYDFYFNGNDNAKWVGNTAMGLGAGFGYRNGINNTFIGQNPGWIYDQSLGRPATFPFLNSGETQITTAQFRNATGCWGFNTFADGVQRNSLQVEIPNVYKITPTNKPYTFNGPSLLMCHFVMGDTTGMYDAADANTSHRVLFANGPTSSVVIAEGNTEAWDCQLTFERALDNLPTATEQFTLTDAGGNRINFTMSTQAGNSSNYTFFYEYRGETGANTYSYQIHVNEQVRTAGGGVTNTLFTSGVRNIAGGFARPARITHMGGADPTDPFYIGGGGATQYRYQNMSANTMFSNLRFYQKTERNGNVANIWDGLLNILIPAFAESFTNNEGLLPATLPNDQFYPDIRNQQIFPAPADMPNIGQYQNFPYNSPENTNTMFIVKETPDAGTGISFPRLNYYDFANVYMQSDIRTPLNGGYKLLPANTMQGIGSGIVDPVAIEPIIDFERPDIPDANGNYIVAPEFEVLQDPANPVGEVDMDFDVIDVPSEKIKIQIPNLPHNSYNGFTKTQDKTIYEIPYAIHETVINDTAIIEVEPPSKCWIPLNNAGEIPINEFEVRIADVENKEATGLQNDTNIVIQIEDNVNLLN